MFDADIKTKGREKQKQQAIEYYKQIYDFINELRTNTPNISLNEIAEKLNKKGFKTRKNKAFMAMQVKRILDRNSSSSFYFTVEQQSNIEALKQENHELRVQLEKAQLEIHSLINERDKQL